LKADYRILIIFGTTIPDTTCHHTIIQALTSHNICFCTTCGNQKHMKSALNEQKKPKTIFDMTDSNLEKDNKILIVFSTNISDITGHQITV